MFGRALSLVLVAASAVLLAGCSPATLARIRQQLERPDEVAFDGAGADAGSGLILVGLRVPSGPMPTGSPVPLEGARYIVRFTNVTDDGKLGDTTVSAWACRVPMAFDAELPEYCLRGESAYRPIHAPPGRYLLDVIEFGNGRYAGFSGFSGGPAQHFLSTKRRAGDPAEHPERSFVVRPGVVTYIGELTFQFEPGGRPTRVVVRRNDAAARRALAELPGVTARLSYEPALGGSGSAVRQLAPETKPGD